MRGWVLQLYYYCYYIIIQGALCAVVRLLRYNVLVIKSLFSFFFSLSPVPVVVFVAIGPQKQIKKKKPIQFL
jgi:hypothetical protein